MIGCKCLQIPFDHFVKLAYKAIIHERIHLSAKMGNISDFMEYKVAMMLWKTFPPVFLVLGTFGNILTIVVLMQRKSRQASTSVYLSGLATSDLITLWSGLFKQWSEHTFEFDLVKMSVVWCKLRYFLVYSGFQCSSWILVVFTLERFISVWFPHKVKIVCTVGRSVVIMTSLVTVLMLMNSHYFYGYNVAYDDKNNVTDCDIIHNGAYVNFIKIWDWIDLCLVALIPLTILSCANMSIIFSIIRRKKTMQNRIAPVNGQSRNTGRKVSQMTVTLIVVNTVFILCTTPMTIYMIFVPFWDDRTLHHLATDELWWCVVNCLAYLNTILNFSLYFLSGAKFRQLVKAFFLREKQTLIFESESARPPPQNTSAK